jgi:DNA-binding response OmpR family regulator
MDKLRILIIEDDVNIARLEQDYLEIEGFIVNVINNGAAGLKTAMQNQWDLIILDLMLPGIDGFELCKKLRDQMNIPMLVVSARSEDIDKVRAFGLGADDYLTKPFSPAELVARVKSHIKRYHRLLGVTEKTDEITYAGLVINTKSHRVYINGHEVSFTSKEFELLVFLASHPDIVFSREQLFDKLWGPDYYGDIGTIAVHIQKIRKKIETDPSNPRYIETVWGAGYRFINI